MAMPLRLLTKNGLFDIGYYFTSAEMYENQVLG
jgi:hypothetical protein